MTLFDINVCSSQSVNILYLLYSCLGIANSPPPPPSSNRYSSWYSLRNCEDLASSRNREYTRFTSCMATYTTHYINTIQDVAQSTGKLIVNVVTWITQIGRLICISLQDSLRKSSTTQQHQPRKRVTLIVSTYKTVSERVLPQNSISKRRE